MRGQDMDTKAKATPRNGAKALFVVRIRKPIYIPIPSAISMLASSLSKSTRTLHQVSNEPS